MKIKLENLFYTYSPKTPFAYAALKNINLDLEGKSFMALIGETGSGKSTLVQHLNGLLTPSSGSVTVSDYQITVTEGKRRLVDLSKAGNRKIARKKKQFDIKTLRKCAGLVFQFPEYQLFEENVLKDVCFGPKNFGATQEEAEVKAKLALKLVGLDETYYNRSPFELSGGEKRRVAIAGIIALEPQVLILDEPTAGLDPEGEKEMMTLFRRIYDAGTSVILVTHNMDIVLKYVDQVCVMSDGKLLKQTDPLSLFQDEDFLTSTAIEPPLVFRCAKELIQDGFKLDMKNIKDISSLALEIKRAKDNG